MNSANAAEVEQSEEKFVNKTENREEKKKEEDEDHTLEEEHWNNESEKEYEGVEVTDEERSTGTPGYWSVEEFELLRAEREGGNELAKEEKLGWYTGTPGTPIEEFEWLAAEREMDPEEF